LKMTKRVKNHIVKYIEEDYSPEQVSATLRIKDKINISLVRIYPPQSYKKPKTKGER